MATTPVDDALVFPQDDGTGVASGSEDFDSAGYLGLIAEYMGQKEYQADGVRLTNVDTSAETIDVSAGHCYVLSDTGNTVQSGAQSLYDSTLPGDHPYLVILPTSEPGLSLGSNVNNDVYLSVNPASQDSVTLHHGTAPLAAPSDPYVKLGSVHTGNGRVNNAHPDPEITGRQVTSTRGYDHQPAPSFSAAITKHPDNPLISGTTGDSDQSYPPHPIIDPPSGDYAVAFKSGGDIYISQAGTLAGLDDSGNKVSVLSPGGAGAWDDAKLTMPLLRYYEPDSGGNPYKMLYSGDDGTERSVGLAVSGSLTSGWSKDAGNPIMTPSDLDSLLQGTHAINALDVSDLVRVDGTWYAFGAAWSNTGWSSGEEYQPWLHWRASGSSLTGLSPDRVLMRRPEINVDGPIFQGPDLVKTQGGIIYTFTAGLASDTPDERRIYAGIGDLDGYRVCHEVFLPVDTGQAWEERRVYEGNFLRKQGQDADGNYFLRPERVNGELQYWYSGHGTGTTNAGYSGLATATALPDVKSKLGGDRRVGGLGTKAYLGTAQTGLAGGSDHQVTLDTKEYDHRNEFDEATNNEFIAEDRGVYDITGSVDFGSVTTDEVCITKIYVNGSEYDVDREGAAGTTSTVKCVTTAELNAGDTVQLYARNAEASFDVNATQNETYLRVHKR